jgi:prefoldin subunit 5
MGSCFGSSESDETLGWLERKFRHIKEEIAMTELRLHDLHQDLTALKSHAEQYQTHIGLECQTPSFPPSL